MSTLYFLMNQDSKIFSFRFHEDSERLTSLIRLEEGSFSIVSRDTTKYPFMLQLTTTEEKFTLWLNGRALPADRENYSILLKCCNIVGRHNTLIHSFGLSLNDNFWISSEEQDYTWSDLNFYSNKFSRRIAFLAMGQQEWINMRDVPSSPEWTTGGVLPKHWRREDGKINLIKGGHGHQAIEYLVSKMLDILEVKHIPYSLRVNDGPETIFERCFSQCEIVTNEHRGLISFREAFLKYYKSTDYITFDMVKDLYDNLGVSINYFYEMVMVDHLIRNTDRHFGNFGYFYDNLSGNVSGALPLFDHGGAYYMTCSNQEIAAKMVTFGYNTLPDGITAEEVFDIYLTDEMKSKVALLATELKEGSIYDLGVKCTQIGVLSENLFNQIIDWTVPMCHTISTWKKGSIIKRKTEAPKMIIWE